MLLSWEVKEGRAERIEQEHVRVGGGEAGEEDRWDGRKNREEGDALNQPIVR